MQRAISLLFLGKVEVLEEYDPGHPIGEPHHQGAGRRAPLRAFPPPRAAGQVSPRVNIYARDNYKCQYCGKKASISELTYDHVVPRSQGGMTEWTTS